MTIISTIFPADGVKNLGANKSQVGDGHSDPRRDSAGATTTAADGAEVRALLLNGAVNSPNRNHRGEPLVTPVINGSGLGLRFSTDKETGTPIITVIDVKSGEMVRQIPAEEVLDFLRQFDNGKGALISLTL